MRRWFTHLNAGTGLALLALALSSNCAEGKESAAAGGGARPNILLVLVDDMGFSDIGCYGGEIRTPTLDRLAANGVRLARFYNGAQCCPSRASLLTGLYPHQAGMGDMNARGASDKFWAQFKNPAYTGFKAEGTATIAEALRAAGYQTFMSGKWHVGDEPGAWPTDRGFDRAFSLLIGACEHFTGYHSWQSKGPIAPFILDGKRLESLPDGFYSTDTFTDYALRFIRETRSGVPWFGYLAYTAPHWPIQAHAEDIARYAEVYGAGPEAVRKRRFERLKEMGFVPSGARLPGLSPRIPREVIEAKAEERELWMRTYAAMIDRVDQNLGRVAALLEERGEMANTLILFMSDNGADTVRGPLWGQVSNTPFRNSKVWVHEGGIATPLIAHWPAGIPSARAGVIEGGYGHFIDIAPTVYEAAGARPLEERNGVSVAPLAGVSLLGAIRGANPLPKDRFLFWERQGNEAVRRGDWKLVRGYDDGNPGGEPTGLGERTGRWELFNLAEDPGETRDLSAEHPEVVSEMRAAWEAWAKEVGVIPREEVAKVLRQWLKK